MRLRWQVVVRFVLVGCLMLAPWVAAAQTGGIAGLASDTTGGAMPGVTVEVRSPALIEGVRVATTGGQGLYRFVDLPVGTYTVTFTLPGFRTTIREGILLSTDFTADVDVEMAVGALEETITVSGASPVVDVQNTVSREIISRDIIDAVPTGRGSGALAALVPGVVLDRPVRQDVGGSRGEQSVRSGIHGGTAGDLRQFVDGMQINMRHGAERQYQPVTEDAEEIAYGLGGGGPEDQLGGIRVNFITKSGGNELSGNFLATGTSARFQGSNLSDDLIDRGLNENNISRLDYIRDVSGSLGGPIRQDKLWFFSSHRWWSSANFVAASFENSTPESFTYTPDFSRPGLNDYDNHTHKIALTWQVNQQNKIKGSYDYQWRCDCHRPASNTLAPEAAWYQTYPADVMITTWTYAPSSRILVEAGHARTIYSYFRDPQPGVGDRISTLELSTNFRYRAAATYESWNNTNTHTRGSMAYVTGAHAFKVGMDMFTVSNRDTERTNQSILYRLRNGVPDSVDVVADPFVYQDRLNYDFGVYVQDQWTIDRLTLNMGARLENVNASVDEQNLEAGRWVPARHFDAVQDAVTYKDFSPRLGAAYDLFGNGKTALKVRIGRYVSGSPRARAQNPVTTSVERARRSWNDLNEDFIAQESELGPLSDSRFGGTAPGTRYAADSTSGWGNRLNNWQASVSVQQELRPGVAVNLGYYRTSWYSFTTRDNLSVTAADFDPFCIVIPTDSRLPGGGGGDLCGNYNINPAKFGQVNTLVTQTSNFGKRTRIYDGVDLTFGARLMNGGVLGGGVSIGHRVDNDCEAIVDSPDTNFCEVTPPFQPQLKLNGSYPLPWWDVLVSATFQNLPGVPISASYSASNAQIEPTLGRPLAGRRRSATIANLFAPQQYFEGRINQFDFRLTKIFTFDRVRLHAKFDVYNVMNASPILSINTRFGSNYLEPGRILDARLAKFEVQMQF